MPKVLRSLILMIKDIALFSLNSFSQELNVSAKSEVRTGKICRRIGKNRGILI